MDELFDDVNTPYDLGVDNHGRLKIVVGGEELLLSDENIIQLISVISDLGFNITISLPED